MSRETCLSMCWAVVAAFGSQTWAGITVDFSFDDNGLATGNGQIIDIEFFTHFTLTSPDTGISHLGPTLFDSDPLGPNAAGTDPDLLVNLGNVLILQNSALPNNDGFFFETPNDEANFEPTGSGTLVFDFTAPVLLQSIDLIDINGGAFVDLVLTDGGGLTRTYNVFEMWSHDIFDTPAAMGYDTLDFTTLAAQVGEGGGQAPASQMAGFDPVMS